MCAVETSAQPATGRIPFCRTEISPEAQAAAARTLASGWVTTGPQVVQFEREFAAYVGAEHAVAVSSCTAAVEIALRALDLPPGGRVLTSTVTFCGAVHAITRAGLRPVLVDVNPDTLMPDELTTREAVRRHGPVDAMVVLHFAGNPAPVAELAAAAGLGLDRVVEDAAHAVGTFVGGRAVGTISAATCFSFYATKNLPIGEGGMITTADERIVEAARILRLHGMSADAWRRYLPGKADWRYEVRTDGLKANMTDLQAAIGIGQLGHLERWQARREEIAGMLDYGLSGVPGVRLPARSATGRHAWHLYVIQVEPEFGVHRDTLITSLAERGIDCSVHFIPLHRQPHFQNLLADQLEGGFPAADEVFERIVSLPFFPGLKDSEVERIVTEIAEIAARAGGTRTGS